MAFDTSTNPFNEAVVALLATNCPALSLTLTTATMFVEFDASISKLIRPKREK